MRVILTTDVDSVGRMGEIKEVKNGLARNYLIPQKMAIRATPGNMKVWEQKSKIIEKRQEGLKAEAQGIASTLDGASVTIPVRVGEENKLFGSVTSQNISDALKEIGHEVSRKNIDLSSPIKEIGTHSITVKLYHEVNATITVEVEGHDADGNIVEITEETEPVAEPEEAVAEEIEEAEESAQETAAEIEDTETDTETEEVSEEAEEVKE